MENARESLQSCWEFSYISICFFLTGNDRQIRMRKLIDEINVFNEARVQ